MKGIKADLRLGESGIPDDAGPFDMVYVVAVFAHLDDEAVQRILCNIHGQLHHSGGKICICEQVGSRHIEGESYRRRTIDEYEQLLGSAGFVVDKQYLIDFWLHRLIFEHRLAHWLYRYCFQGTNHERRIAANKTWWFRFLSNIFTGLSWPRLFLGRHGWGYAFITASPR